jgi:diguanylate cyclase (GGDEF)-like protein
MFRSRTVYLVSAALAMLGLTALYSVAGSARTLAQLDLFALAAQGAIALMAGIWFTLVLSQRPATPSTVFAAAGLAALVLGAWAACLAELFIVGAPWGSALPALPTLGGVGCLGWGLASWRREQLSSEPIQQRERLLRDHRSFDQLTQVGDADYLREQLRIEHRHGRRCCLLMLDIDGFHLINRDHGQREGDRLLQAVTHVLLLNLRSGDLLCRYAGDRFGILLPATELEPARAIGDQLRRAVATLRHHPLHGGQPIGVTMRSVERALDGDPRQLLKDANRSLERRMARQEADQLPTINVA